MSGITRVEIDQLFVRLQRAAFTAGMPSSDFWSLRPATETERTWTITDQQGRVLLVLGYTRREAHAALLSMVSILAVLHGS